MGVNINDLRGCQDVQRFIRDLGRLYPASGRGNFLAVWRFNRSGCHRGMRCVQNVLFLFCLAENKKSP